MATLHSRYAPDHPAAQGHFPDNPVIPGAVLLSDTVRAIASALGADVAHCRVGAAKFLSFVRPGDSVTIEYTGTRERGAGFVCSIETRSVLTGSVTWGGTTLR